MTPVIAPDSPGAAHIDPQGARVAEPPPETPAGDRAPKRRARAKKQAKPAISDAALRDALTELLCAPAMAYGMIGQDWPARHVVKTGPELADQMVEFGKVSPQFRGYLERAITGQAPIALMMAVYSIGMATAAYLLPQLAYFGLVPRAIGSKFAGETVPDPVAPPATFGMDGNAEPTVVSTDD